MKTYVITVSEKFPKTHIRAGEQTNFVDKIDSINCNLPFPPFDPKIHTIRANFDLWEKRFKQIDLGNAVLSIRVWEGKPYRSKQKEIFRLDRTRGIGIEQLIKFEDGFWINGECKVKESDLAKNDGLSLADFKEWFSDYELTKPMAVIHFTEFRYGG